MRLRACTHGNSEQGIKIGVRYLLIKTSSSNGGAFEILEEGCFVRFSAFASVNNMFRK